MNSFSEDLRMNSEKFFALMRFTDVKSKATT